MKVTFATFLMAVVILAASFDFVMARLQDGVQLETNKSKPSGILRKKSHRISRSPQKWPGYPTPALPQGHAMSGSWNPTTNQKPQTPGFPQPPQNQPFREDRLMETPGNPVAPKPNQLPHRPYPARLGNEHLVADLQFSSQPQSAHQLADVGQSGLSPITGLPQIKKERDEKALEEAITDVDPNESDVMKKYKKDVEVVVKKNMEKLRKYEEMKTEYYKMNPQR